MGKLNRSQNAKLRLLEPCSCRECKEARREKEAWERIAREARAVHGDKPTMNRREATLLAQKLARKRHYYELRTIDGAWFLYTECFNEYEFIWNETDRQRCKYVAIMGKMLYEVEESA